MNSQKMRDIAVLCLGILLGGCVTHEPTQTPNPQQEDYNVELDSFELAWKPDTEGRLSGGEAVYELWCSSCHAAGDYAGTIRLGATRGMENAVLTDRNNLPSVYIESIVRNGIGSMPAFRPSEISPADLRELTEFLTTNDDS